MHDDAAQTGPAWNDSRFFSRLVGGTRLQAHSLVLPATVRSFPGMK
jgi:hypothetical protein